MMRPIRSGTVEEAGSAVTRFEQGDEVFAMTGFQFGAHAQFVCVPENAMNAKMGLVAKKPVGMSFDEAAAGVATGGLTALELLEKAGVQPGQEVLVYGASGSVGVFAVQLAKHFGAQVTGVCSTRNLEVVTSLGADRVVDYTKEDVSTGEGAYSVIIDAVDKLPRAAAKRILTTGGLYLNAVKDTGTGGRIGTEDLVRLKDLVEDGTLKTIIDRTYPLEEMVEAHRYVEKGHKRGHVVITVSHPDGPRGDGGSSPP